LVWKCLRKWREHHCLVKFVSRTESKTGAEFCAFIVNKHVQAIFILLHSCFIWDCDHGQNLIIHKVDFCRILFSWGGPL
jgi:hypothetical protein